MYTVDIFSNAQRAQVLTEALPYIRKYNSQIVVVKYGGNAMIHEQLKTQVMEDILLLWLVGVKVVLVHGGGPEVSDMMRRLTVRTRDHRSHGVQGNDVRRRRRSTVSGRFRCRVAVQVRRWQPPHQKRLRPASTLCRTEDPQRRHGIPWRW